MLNGHKMGLLRAFAAVDNLAEKYLGNLGKYTQRHKMVQSQYITTTHILLLHRYTHILRARLLLTYKRYAVKL